jgi:hypothetical protein
MMSCEECSSAVEIDRLLGWYAAFRRIRLYLVGGIEAPGFTSQFHSNIATPSGRNTAI